VAPLSQVNSAIGIHSDVLQCEPFHYAESLVISCNIVTTQLTHSHLRSILSLSLSPALTTNRTMSAVSTSPVTSNLDSSNLEQLKQQAVALEGDGQHDEALAKYEEVLVIQQRDLPPGHLDTHETLTSIDRVIDQLKYHSVDNLEVSASANSLTDDGRWEEGYSLMKLTYERQLVTLGEEDLSTVTTMHNMGMRWFVKGDSSRRIAYSRKC
jgi:hypothetical protein